MFTPKDRDTLALALDLMEWAKEEIDRVLNRHTRDCTAQMISFALGAKQDIDNAELEADRFGRYLGWQGGHTS